MQLQGLKPVASFSLEPVASFQSLPWPRECHGGSFLVARLTEAYLVFNLSKLCSIFIDLVIDLVMKELLAVCFSLSVTISVA